MSGRRTSGGFLDFPLSGALALRTLIDESPRDRGTRTTGECFVTTAQFPGPLRDVERKILDRIVELAVDFDAAAADYDERAVIAVEHLDALHDADVDRAVLPEQVGVSA